MITHCQHECCNLHAMPPGLTKAYTIAENMKRVVSFCCHHHLIMTAWEHGITAMMVQNAMSCTFSKFPSVLCMLPSITMLTLIHCMCTCSRLWASRQDPSATSYVIMFCSWSDILQSYTLHAIVHADSALTKYEDPDATVAARSHALTGPCADPPPAAVITCRACT